MYNRLFQNYTPLSVYWLGLLTADGSLGHNKRHSVCLGLKSSDGYLVETFTQDLGYSITYTKYRKCGNCNMAYALLYDKLLYNDILNMHLMWRKCKKLTSDNIPNIFFGHFLRGVFDGDGSISFANQNFRQHRFIIYGYYPFLYGLHLKLLAYDIHSLIFPGEGAYRLAIRQNNSFKLIYNLMYEYDYMFPYLVRKKLRMDLATNELKKTTSRDKCILRKYNKPAEYRLCQCCSQKYLVPKNKKQKCCSKKCSSIKRHSPLI